VTFDIETASRTRSVQVVRAPGGYEIRVDGRRRVVDAVPVGPAAWSMLIAGRSYEVGLVERAAGELTVHVNGRPVAVRLGGRLRGRRRAPADADAGRGPQAVAAPMPGRVVKILVEPGQRVQARQGVVVVEAMKMENELRAARAGVVREVRVREGASVDANTVLVIIE
jgi:biotin carboxyl carrier protein